MANCGCNTDCNCDLTSGSCTAVTGNGNPGTPFVVSVVVDSTTVFCQGGVLVAKLNTIDTNTVDLSGDGTVANPLKADVILTPNGNVPDPDALGTGNLIKLGPTGIYVSCEDVQDCIGAAITTLSVSDCLDYDDVNNTITVRICGPSNGLQCVPTGGAACPAGGLLVIPSADPGNALVFGTDGRLFAPGTAIQAGPCLTLTGSGTTGDPYVISPQVAPELNGLECIPGQGLAVIPSSDGNNGLVFGSDQRLFINNCPFIVNAAQTLFGNNGPCFELQGDGCNTALSAILRISTFPCNGVQCRPDGLFVLSDPTALPDPVKQTQNTPGFPGLGPFNGTGGPNVVDGPQCITIVNPSPCRDMLTTPDLKGFTDVGRLNGLMSASFETADGPGGPWTRVHVNTQQNPTPPSRYTLNAAWLGNEISIPPGGSRQVCARTLVQFAGANTGRLFFSERTITLTGKWAQ